MYSESDIDQAVAAGVMPEQVASDFRHHVAALRATPAVDEEDFRFLTGFNDIFVTIAIALLLVAVANIGAKAAAPAGAGAVAAVAWLLATYFTARRRMALPSIVLLLAFVGGIAAMIVSLGLSLFAEPDERRVAGISAVAAGVAAFAAWVHWRRFMVPITPAAGAAAAVAVVVSLLLTILPESLQLAWPLLFAGGIAVFAYAMHWDLSDRARRTRRSDVAFWLHLIAAPMIAHSTFQMMGVFAGDMGLGKALLVLLLYIAFALVALVVDRRALLVSSLVYVLYAMSVLIRTAGSTELSLAFTSLVIGSALLSLSAFWQPIRAGVVARLGRWGERLPPAQTAG
ncbi:hypothetical protein [Sphingomonas sp. 8AM]|uniref:hypothetical protein n=1 Tax=Sphingomonas sp. 8AM TaxID=2653170 RepID=UPI0012EFA9C0|nr:hypothetical protein [Sphingomonas sp. 8AM]VXC78776.1 conserved membrane hypothetical protein [Sphingomonas sp. 8AM]